MRQEMLVTALTLLLIGFVFTESAALAEEAGHDQHAKEKTALMPGDFDFDGEVTLNDAVVFHQTLRNPRLFQTKNPDLTAEETLTIGDLNSDQKINQTDLMLLLKTLQEDGHDLSKIHEDAGSNGIFPPPPSSQPVSSRTAAGQPIKQQEPGPGEFPIFDALAHRGKPDLTEYGLTYLPGWYEARIWPNDADRSKMPSKPWIQRLARWHAKRHRTVFLNIEHWPTQTFYGSASVSKVKHNHNRLRQIIEWIKEEEPDLAVGYYGLMPVGEYIGPVRGIEWRAEKAIKESERFVETGLADAVDYVAPSLYVRYSDDPEEWKRWATFVLTEAKRYGKPIYPFLWPRFHDQGPENLRLREIPAEFFRMQLEFCREHADGVIIWGGYKEAWDSEATWWKELRAFAAEQHHR